MRAIFYLDGYVEGSGIAKGDFTLKAPNIILTEVWKDGPVRVSVRLDALAADSHDSNRPLACAEGKVMRREFAQLL